MKRFQFGLAAVLLAIMWPCAWANADSISDISGGAFVPITDGTDHSCIDVSKNLISMNLVSAQVQREQSLWQKLLYKHQSLGVKFDVVITDAKQQPFDFPRVKKLSPMGQFKDIALLPMQFSIMSKYALFGSNKTPYNNVELDLYFVQVDTKSAAIKALDNLINFSKKLNLPPNPYVVGVGYFGDFANMIWQQDLHNGESVSPDATFNFDLAANDIQAAAGKCPDRGLSTGVQSVVWDYDGKGSGEFIKVNDLNKYCFWYDRATSRVVFDGKGSGATNCSVEQTATAKPLENPLVTFVVDAWPMAGTPQPAPSQVASRIQPMLTSNKFSATDVAYFAKHSFVGNESAIANIHPHVVTDFLDILSKEQSDPHNLEALRAQMTSEDAATALAIRRCVVVGIDVKDCK
ncbi:hypothetical protein ACFPPA_10505 [Rhodanobacter ginsengisoli]|uniref:Uncharacterized protein n=1 Tax=Rhodanobacter ginsengisoli TaxID=418646 RepID=A0ABW0QPH1_9GAMM